MKLQYITHHRKKDIYQSNLPKGGDGRSNSNNSHSQDCMHVGKMVRRIKVACQARLVISDRMGLGQGHIPQSIYY